MKPGTVAQIRNAVKGKKYSTLTYEQWEVLFKGSPSNIDTLCAHNGIENDSGLVSTAMPNTPPNPAKKPEPKVESK